MELLESLLELFVCLSDSSFRMCDQVKYLTVPSFLVPRLWKLLDTKITLLSGNRYVYNLAVYFHPSDGVICACDKSRPAEYRPQLDNIVCYRISCHAFLVLFAPYSLFFPAPSACQHKTLLRTKNRNGLVIDHQSSPESRHLVL